MEWPNDLKLSDRGVRRGTCMVGGKVAAEDGAVTHGAVRCSAWLGVRSNWIKRVESEFSVRVALPESALGNSLVAPRWMRPKLPVGREDDKANGRSVE